jgi:hypothetical protein
VATWHYLAGGGALIGAALLVRKKVDDGTIAPDTGLSVKKGSLLSSEQARLEQLIPAAQAALRSLIAALEGEGIDLYVGSTRRNPAQQASIVAKGNSATQHSWHLLGRGVDVYPRVDGQPDLAGKNLDLFRRIHAVAPRFGWRGLAFNPDGSKRYITGTKGKIWDGGHLEFPEGMTWAQAAAAGSSKVALG